MGISLVGCGIISGKVYDDTNKPYYSNIIGKELILVNNVFLIKKDKNITPSKKEPNYFITLNKKDRNIQGLVFKGTKLKCKNVYTYYANFEANGETFYIVEILDGNFKGVILSAYGTILKTSKDKNFSDEFNPQYALEATPENIARIEKEIAEEKKAAVAVAK